MILVIAMSSVVNDFSGVNNITEPVLIHTLILKSTIKAFDKTVLCRLARLNKQKLNGMLIGPLHREILDAGQALDPESGSHCVHDEIRRPPQVRISRTERWKTFCWHSFTTSSALNTQTAKMLKAVYAHVTNMQTFSSQ